MVRSYQAQDSEQVKALILSILANEYPFDKNAYSESDIFDISGTYSGTNNAFFVYTEGDRVVGTVGIKSDSDTTALLRRLFVDPKFRKKGIGKKLVEHGIDFCRQNGYGEIVFRATDRMKSAMGLLKKVGFYEKDKLEISGFHIHIYNMPL